jgi:hypothetical protein
MTNPFISGMDFQILFTSFTCFSILTLVAFFSKKKLFHRIQVHRNEFRRYSSKIVSHK